MENVVIVLYIYRVTHCSNLSINQRYKKYWLYVNIYLYFTFDQRTRVTWYGRRIAGSIASSDITFTKEEVILRYEKRFRSKVYVHKKFECHGGFKVMCFQVLS